MTIGGGDNDLVFGASVNDTTQEFFDKFDQNVKNVEKTVQTGFGNANETIKKTGVETGLVAGITAALSEKLLSMGLQAFESLSEFAKQAVEVRVQLEAVATSLEIVGNNAGYSNEEISKMTENITNLGYTTKDAMTSLTKMIQGEIDLKDAVSLSKLALDASAVSGMSEVQAQEALVRAIEYRNKRTLVTMGIVVDFTAADRTYAAELGKDVKNLSDQEKKQSAVNAVLKEGINIQGAYEAHMQTTAGLRQQAAKDQEKMFEELGVMFEPAVNAAWKDFVVILEDLLKFLEDNKDQMEEFGKVLASVAGITFDELVVAIKAVIKLAGDFGNAWDDAYQKAARSNAQYYGQAEQKHYDFWKEVLKSFDFILAKAGGFAVELTARIGSPFVVLFAMLKDPKNGAKVFSDWVKSIQSGEMEKNLKQLGEDTYTKILQGFYDKQKDTIWEPIIPKDDANLSKIQTDAQKLADALVNATAKMKELKDSMAEAAATRALQKTRSAIEDAMKEGWRQEDLARTLADSIAEITKNAEDAKTKALEDANNNRIKIEEDYHRRLREIMSDFNFEASELARRRDAVGILALTRQTNRTLEKEKDAYKERKAEAEKQYRETIKEIDKSVDEQLKKLEDSRKKQEEDYQRSLDRERQLKELHDKWEEEDIAKANAKREKELFDSFTALDGMTAKGLDTMRKLWLNYRDDLATIMSQISQIQNQGLGMVGGQGGHIVMGGTIVGQAGQVSQMLTPANMTPSQLGNVPAVSPRGSASKKEIKVTVDGNGLSPYIQRVVANTLMEIERNRA
jgi:hypothetical protein